MISEKWERRAVEVIQLAKWILEKEVGSAWGAGPTKASTTWWDAVCLGKRIDVEEDARNHCLGVRRYVRQNESRCQRLERSYGEWRMVVVGSEEGALDRPSGDIG